MKGMTGNAGDPPLVVERHIRRDAHGRYQIYGMSQHGLGAVRALMACPAYGAKVVAERQFFLGEGKVRVAFNARHLQRAVMRSIRTVRRNRGEQGGQYDACNDHRVKVRI